MLDLDREALFLALARAEDAVSRLDGRAQACAFIDGWAARIDFAEAHAWGWISGEIVDLEDLVLHDAQMDARLPDQALRATHGLVRARRRARDHGRELQSAAGVAWLAGRRAEPPVRLPSEAETAGAPDRGRDDEDLIGALVGRLRSITRGETSEPEAAIAEWVDWKADLPARAPALLRAAAALEGWRLVNPLPREPYVGAIVVAHDLRVSGRARAYLPGVEQGRRAHLHPPRGFGAPIAVRLAYWLRVLAVNAEAGLAELRRLELARQVVGRRIAGRRAHDRSADLLDLLLARPLVSAPMAAQHLGVADHSARRLLAGMGSSVMEISGRSRFRAWRL